MQAQLTVILGPDAGNVFALTTDKVVLGRGVDSEICLASPAKRVSRRHAKLLRRDGAWFLEDMESQNGTRLDGRRVEGPPLPLADGAVIRIGEYDLLFEQSAAPLTARISPAEPEIAGRVRARRDDVEESAVVPLMNQQAESFRFAVRFSAFAKSTHRLAGGGEGDAAVRDLLSNLASELDSVGAGIALLDEHGDLLGGPAVRRDGGEAFTVLRKPSLQCLREQAALRFDRTDEPSSHLLAPLTCSGRRLGVVQFDRRVKPTAADAEPTAPDPSQAVDLEFLSAAADLIAASLEQVRLHRLASRLNRQIRRNEVCPHPMLGGGSLYTAMLADADRISRTNAGALMWGEAGTGKRTLAARIHFSGSRADGPLVFFRPAGLPQADIEAELFGVREPGAALRPGRLQLADRGTLVLVEPADLPEPVQMRLLRFLGTGQFEPVGAGEPVRADVRIISTSRRDPAVLAETPQINAELLARLSALSLRVPALREHAEDVPALADFFLAWFGRGLDRPMLRLAADVRVRLTHLSWPGNVRQLRSAMERLAVLCPGDEVAWSDWQRYLSGELELEPPTRSEGLKAVRENGVNGGPSVPAAPPAPSFDLEEAERRQILAALEHTRSSPSEAARLLGIARGTLYRKMERYGIRPPKEDKEEG